MAAKTKKVNAEKAAQEAAAASAVTVDEIAPEVKESTAEGESGTNSDTDAEDGGTDADDNADAATVEVVVCAKRTVRHDGKVYGEKEALTMLRDDAQALKNAGFVAYLEDVRQVAQAREGVSVSVSNGVGISQE